MIMDISQVKLSHNENIQLSRFSSVIINKMGADDLAQQEARASTAMVLT